MRRKSLQKLPLSQLKLKAQKVFNRFIRERDADKGCISCGAGVDHAGHYYSQGHHGNLRYNETNTNGQCLRCNNFLHGNLINYRNGLLKRYGEDKVLMLDSAARQTKKWTELELLMIIQMYKK